MAAPFRHAGRVRCGCVSASPQGVPSVGDSTIRTVITACVRVRVDVLIPSTALIVCGCNSHVPFFGVDYNLIARKPAGCETRLRSLDTKYTVTHARRTRTLLFKE